MKKAIFYLLACVLLPVAASADEGMWLVSTFRDVIYPQMKKEGLKLKPGEIYNEESPALCNAIVAVDGGMGTGSVISDKGLVITNHHVAYGDIHSLSTPAKNYLEEGFWALEQKDELPLKGKTVTFLRQVRDVTDEAQAIRDSLEKANSLGIFGTRKVYGILERKYGGDTPFEVECASMWKGKKYLLFYYETYKDVRLVGAPPVKIGAFGGEQDNWGWPQHKGDFALYRVYGDAKGRPAAYSENNVPITPRKVLNVSTSGIHDGDYAMVIGFPGRTNRYMSSQAVREKEHVTNPVVIKARRDRLDIMLRHMEADPDVRLMYSDKYFNISNYADYAKWENICLRRYDVIGIRAAEEARLAAWIDADPARRAEYGDLLANLKKGYEARAEAVREKCYYQETWIRPSDVMMTANRLGTLVDRMQRDGIASVQDGDKNFAGVKSNTRRMMKDFDLATDKEVLTRMMESFTDNVPREMWGEQLPQLYDRFKGNVPALVDYAFENTCCTSYEKLCAWFAQPRTAEEIPLRPDGGDGQFGQLAAFRRETQTGRGDVGHRRRQGGTPLHPRHLRDARIGRHAPISRRQLDNAPHLRNRRPGLAQGRRALRLPFDDRRLPRKIQSRRLRIPCRRPDVFAHPQQGLGPLGRKRPAVRQFPHQQRHHGRQFGKPGAQRPGRRDRTGVRRQPRVDVGRHLFPPDQLQDSLRRHPLRAVDHGQIRRRRKADR